MKKLIPLVLTALTVALIAPALTAEAQEGGRKVLYLFSADFPPNAATQYPTPPVQETKFWQLLDREMKATDSLVLTENLENADYRVELRCAGVLKCSKLAVDIKDVERNLLGSFYLKNYSPLWGIAAPNLEKVARDLTWRLDERFKQLEQGGYGHTD